MGQTLDIRGVQTPERYTRNVRGTHTREMRETITREGMRGQTLKILWGQTLDRWRDRH